MLRLPPQFTLNLGSVYGVTTVVTGSISYILDERLRLPQLAEGREAVRREWFAGRRREANEAFYRYLREKYTVIVEEPEWADKAPRRQAEVR